VSRRLKDPGAHDLLLQEIAALPLVRDLRLARRSGACSPRLPGVCPRRGGVERPRRAVRLARDASVTLADLRSALPTAAIPVCPGGDARSHAQSASGRRSVTGDDQLSDMLQGVDA
jgi:hypothetical protein